MKHQSAFIHPHRYGTDQETRMTYECEPHANRIAPGHTPQRGSAVAPQQPAADHLDRPHRRTQQIASPSANAHQHPLRQLIQRFTLVLILLSLLAACGNPGLAPQPTLQSAQRPTSIPISSPTVPAPTPAQATPTTPQQTGEASVPACTFDPNAVPLAPDPLTVDDFIFDAPQVVATGYDLGIDEWLPDSQRLLFSWGTITRTVGILNTANDQIDPYATTNFATWSHWSAAEQGVVYVDQLGDQLRLNLSHGPQLPPTVLTADLGPPFVTLSSGGTALTTTPNRPASRPYVHELTAGQLGPARELVTAPELQTIAGPVIGEYLYYPFYVLRLVWRPDGQQALVYNYERSYLADFTQQSICELSLGQKDGEQRGERRRALKMQWSSDGRFLAAETTIGHVDHIPFSDLTVLDLQTGNLQQISLDTKVFYEFAWIPDSHLLVATGEVEPPPTTQNRKGLFIIDGVRGKVQRVLPDEAFGYGAYEGISLGGLSIAPDGRTLAVTCPVWPVEATAITTYRLCTIRIDRAK